MDDVAFTQSKLIDVAEYYRMAEAGMFSAHPRVELIEGEIVEMASIGIGHIGAVMALTELLVPPALGRVRVSIQNPLRLDNLSEPEPDVVLLRKREDRYLTGQHPLATDALLVIEVADSSLEYDKRVKMPLYARSGIAEFWLVDVDAASITVCQHPAQDRYTDIKIYKGTDRVEPLALPGASIQVSDIVTTP
jgi:Uma2 family endonuclease